MLRNWPSWVLAFGVFATVATPLVPMAAQAQLTQPEAEIVNKRCDPLNNPSSCRSS